MIFSGIPFIASPNWSSRDGMEVDAIVLHHISLPPGTFGGSCVLDFFLNRLDPGAHAYFFEIAHLRVSCHFFVDRRGRVVQLVDTDRKAWHAGVSELDGRADVNRFSVGIELEGDGETPYPEAQYEALRPLLQALRAAHPAIAPDRIVGHEHVAPGRKRDPGPLFDWPRVRGWFAESLS